MRTRLLIALLAALTFLSGCGSDDTESQQIRAKELCDAHCEETTKALDALQECLDAANTNCGTDVTKVGAAMVSPIRDEPDLPDEWTKLMDDFSDSTDSLRGGSCLSDGPATDDCTTHVQEFHDAGKKLIGALKDWAG